MKRIAAHYLFIDRLYPLHFIELQDKVLKGVFPLNQEQAGVVFWDGTLVVLPAEKAFSPLELEGWIGQQTDLLFKHLNELTKGIRINGVRVVLYQLQRSTDGSIITNLRIKE